MANEFKSNFKRHYPRLGKCICCCCLSKETGVKVCTYILIVYYGLSLIGTAATLTYDTYYFNTFLKIMSYVSALFVAAVVISLILLLIGISKVNFTFLNQFKIVYLVFLIYEVCSSIYSFILIFDDDYVNDQIKMYKELMAESSGKKIDTVNINEKEYTEYIKTSAKYTLIGVFIEFLILIYYYLVTCSYVEDVQEDAMEEDDIRNLEDNQY